MQFVRNSYRCCNSCTVILSTTLLLTTLLSRLSGKVSFFIGKSPHFHFHSGLTGVSCATAGLLHYSELLGYHYYLEYCLLPVSQAWILRYFQSEQVSLVQQAATSNIPKANPIHHPIPIPPSAAQKCFTCLANFHSQFLANPDAINFKFHGFFLRAQQLKFTETDVEGLQANSPVSTFSTTTTSMAPLKVDGLMSR